MRKAVVVTAILLAGCASPQQRANDLVDARATCIGAGFQGDALAACTLDELHRTQAARSARVRAFGEAMTHLSDQMQQQRQANTPHVTNCQQYGNQIQCVSQ